MSECRVCASKTDAFMCIRCGRKLEDALAELPADMRDLEMVAARQATGPLGLGAPSRSCERPSKDVAWQAPGPLTPEALGEAPWEFAPGAADQLWAMANTVTTWARHLAESRGLPLPPLTRFRPAGLRIWRNRMYVTVQTWTLHPVVPVAQWLQGNIDAIRHDEAAEQIYDELTGLHEENERWILGRRGTEVFAGRCDAAQVTFVEGEPGTLVPVAAICNAALYGRSEEAEVRCQACGMRYSLEARLAEMRNHQINEQLARAHTIANALTTIEEPLTPELLRKWIQRDAMVEQSPEGPACLDCKHSTCVMIRRPLILQKGTDDEGKALYRVGDVRARLALVQRQRGVKLSA